MRKTILGFILIAAFCSPCFAAVPKYEIDASIDTQNHTLSAEEAVVFTNNTGDALDEVYFHIYPNREYTDEDIAFMYRYAGYFKINPYPDGFDKGDMQIQSITIGNMPVEYAIEGEDLTILKVNLPRPLNPGASVEIKIAFNLDIPHSFGRFGWHEDIITLNRWYPVLSVLDDDGWHNYPFYLYHQPYFSQASIYKVKLTVPRQETVAHTGALVKEEYNRQGTKSLFIETELPVRDFSLGISPSFKVYSKEEKGVKINSFYLPEDEARAKQAHESAKDLMDFYGGLFGKYPYKEFNIVPSYLGSGGYESSNLIFIDTRVYKLPGFLIRYFDFLIAHETGHQWFYNLVGSDEYKETFLDEGINSYWILRHAEDKYGDNAEVLVLPDVLKPFMPNFSFRDARIARYSFLAKNGYDRPILGELSSFKEPSSIFALTYGKGSAVIAMLSGLITEEVFLESMRRYARDFKFKNAKVTDFIKICEEASGKELGSFFRQWLETDKQCDYAISDVRGRSVVLQRKGQIRMPLDLQVTYSDASTESFTWDGEEAVKAIDFDKTIKAAAIDPQDMLLDIDKTNNVWPRHISIKPVPVYFFAYEVPVFLVQDAYNVIIGPDISDSLGIKASLQKPEDSILYVKSGYDFNSESIKSTLGYQLKHLGDTHMTLGFELFNWESSRRKEDRTGGKLYLRKELWPAPYGLAEINDHITFYMLRERRFEGLSVLSGAEDLEHLHYRQKDEAIFGIEGSLSRAGPYPDPVSGWKFIPVQEFGMHALGGDESFWRMSLEFDKYHQVFPGHNLAGRVKFGWGEAHDKKLFQIGGDEGLRGYDRKTIDGSRMLLMSLEYRATILDEIKLYFLDNIIHLDAVQVVPFFDIGKAWGASFNGPDFKKNAGLGLVFYMDIAGFLERLGVRLDVARAIDDSDEDDTRLWLGVNHAF